MKQYSHQALVSFLCLALPLAAHSQPNGAPPAQSVSSEVTKNPSINGIMSGMTVEDTRPDFILQLINDGGGNALYGSNTSTGIAVYGVGVSGAGVHGDSSSDVGVVGISQVNDGVRGVSVSGHGTTGFASANGMAGVYGVNDNVNAAAGVFGRSVNGWGTRGDSDNGDGVYGQTNATNRGGVVGRADNGYGVSGYSANRYGVWGRSNGIGGGTAGVYGLADSLSGIGVFGEANGLGSSGVVGKSINGLAGTFIGNVGILGQLDASDKHFKIDHPVDPANQYLVHASVESAERMNIYDGIVILDALGEATVTMPDWFEALNRDFRYQLTSINGFAPVYIAEEMSGNRFKIAGGQPGGKVSWQVSGTRHDPYAEAHPMQVEEEKAGPERGYYLHPSLYNQPETKSIENARTNTGK